MKKNELTENQLRRMPFYLEYLRKKDQEGVTFISCQKIADDLFLNKEQVRKDIAISSSTLGIPNKGRIIKDLIKDIEKHLGLDNVSDAILIGVGSFGTALLNYNGFINYGLKIVAGFDKRIDIPNKINNIPLYNIKDLVEVNKDLKARIGIITVPMESALEVSKLLVEIGIEGIWNFAPIKLDLGENVVIANMDLASSLASLSHKLYIKHQNKKEN